MDISTRLRTIKSLVFAHCGNLDCTDLIWYVYKMVRIIKYGITERSAYNILGVHYHNLVLLRWLSSFIGNPSHVDSIEKNKDATEAISRDISDYRCVQ